MWVCVGASRRGAAPQGPAGCGSCSLLALRSAELAPCPSCPQEQRTALKRLVWVVAPPYPTGSCPLCAGIRGAMPPPFFPMSWKKLAG